MNNGMRRCPASNPNSDAEDFTWNAVWQSGAVIHNDGWSFEMFIPYSAIRFGKKDVQNWGFNITRRRRKTEQQYTWNPIDPNINGFLTQEGLERNFTYKTTTYVYNSLHIFLFMRIIILTINLGQKNWTTR